MVSESDGADPFTKWQPNSTLPFMASERRGAPSLERMILEELDPSRPPGSHMRVIFEEIIDLRRGEVLGYEVLTRVDAHPSLRISPEMWFAKARNLGLEAQIEARAVELALAALPPGKGMLSVNFSPDCLDTPEVLTVLDRLAALDRVTVIELSEHHHVDSATLAHSLDHVRERGMLVAVDDAGTGESGPQFVEEVQPDIIKIDRTHVSQLHRNPYQRCFVHRYAEMAGDSESMIVTEGVSSSRIADALAELGAKWGMDFMGQGHWLSHSRAIAARLNAG